MKPDENWRAVWRALYDYMQRKLLEANLEQSDPPLGEVLSLRDFGRGVG
jgi:hypothetical protein